MTRAVDGNGQYTSDSFTPTAPRTYRWVAAHEDDVGNAPVTTACGEANETIPEDATQESAAQAEK